MGVGPIKPTEPAWPSAVAPATVDFPRSGLVRSAQGVLRALPQHTVLGSQVRSTRGPGLGTLGPRVDLRQPTTAKLRDNVTRDSLQGHGGIPPPIGRLPTLPASHPAVKCPAKTPLASSTGASGGTSTSTGATPFVAARPAQCSVEMFAVGELPPVGPARWKYLDDPKNWRPERKRLGVAS
jgi:hypothetical protein